MAKKSSNLRVFELARELGVKSKEIVARCEAEEIPDITNHMSAVSAGLAETVRGWFYQGEESSTTQTATAVEPAPEPKIKTSTRAKAKKSTAKKSEKKEATTSAKKKKASQTKKASKSTKKTTADSEEDTKTKTKEEPKTPEPVAKAETPAKDKQPTEQVAEQQPPAEEQKQQAESPAEPERIETEQQQDQSDKPRSRQEAVMNVPQRPDVVKPVGPKLEQPDKIKLSGPKVIRVEKAESVPAPSKRGHSGGPGRSGGGGGPRMPSRVDRKGGSGAGRSSRRNKRRSASAGDNRRGGRGGGETPPKFWREQDLLERERRLSRSGGFFKQHRRDNLKRTSTGEKSTTAAETGGVVEIAEPITIKDLSAATGVKTGDILKKLFLQGETATINSSIDAEKAQEIMLEYEIELKVEEHKTASDQIKEQFAEREMINEQARAPVVTILGHVDHGKTTLLDHIRKANVAEGEAGGITQATSAFQVPVSAGDRERMVTFIDTPGHEAFTEMRSRGAQVTDVVVLVVAADDGVMPQTAESINHAKAADVPIMVALNKIDKQEATETNIQRILGQLQEHDLTPVEWGGSTEVIRVSALKDEGIQDLLDILDYQADLLELTADFGGDARGTVLEAQIEEGRGPVARLVVQDGQLKKGDCVVIGRAYGRIRDIVNDHGQRIEQAGPSTPVAISGISELPDAGDKFYIVTSLKDAESAAAERKRIERERELAAPKITLDNIFDHLAEGQKKELSLVIKGDVQGSVETIKSVLEKISTDEVKISIKHAGVGGVNDSDISLAEASDAIIIGFNVTTSPKARRSAEERSIDVRLYDVIYDITDDVTRAASGLLEPELKLEVLGHAEVREVFRISKVGAVAGCYVTDGTVERNSKIRVTRDEIVVEKDRRLEQLKRFKDDAREVRSGQECGMKIEGYNDIKEGDVIECYKTIEVARTL